MFGNSSAGSYYGLDSKVHGVWLDWGPLGQVCPIEPYAVNVFLESQALSLNSSLWPSAFVQFGLHFERAPWNATEWNTRASRIVGNYFAILSRTTVLALFFVKSTLLVSQLWSRSLTSHGRWNGLTQTAIVNFQPFSAGCETVSHSETCKLKHIRISSWFFGKKRVFSIVSTSTMFLCRWLYSLQRANRDIPLSSCCLLRISKFPKRGCIFTVPEIDFSPASTRTATRSFTLGPSLTCDQAPLPPSEKKNDRSFSLLPRISLKEKESLIAG